MIDIYKKYHNDEESCHEEMDGAIETLLMELGYTDALYIFKNTPKWYA